MPKVRTSIRSKKNTAKRRSYFTIIILFIFLFLYYWNPVGVNPQLYNESIEVFTMIEQANNNKRNLTEYQLNKLEQYEDKWTQVLTVATMDQSNIEERNYEQVYETYHLTNDIILAARVYEGEYYSGDGSSNSQEFVTYYQKAENSLGLNQSRLVKLTFNIKQLFLNFLY